MTSVRNASSNIRMVCKEAKEAADHMTPRDAKRVTVVDCPESYGVRLSPSQDLVIFVPKRCPYAEDKFWDEDINFPEYWLSDYNTFKLIPWQSDLNATLRHIAVGYGIPNTCCVSKYVRTDRSEPPVWYVHGKLLESMANALLALANAKDIVLGEAHLWIIDYELCRNGTVATQDTLDALYPTKRHIFYAKKHRFIEVAAGDREWGLNIRTVQTAQAGADLRSNGMTTMGATHLLPVGWEYLTLKIGVLACEQWSWV
ncbi:hypothetical protein JDV02_002998 [Purpureocillium takamizusanense]|uniref:Uncharacterized protein n=1 Tax=Purpureocillium takamizusanense TaxID=2060973 RepID=A0A9Q8QC67_9HYPO|nr:uncharacterized protein JDV02_002998 [Purpureocillium takamizusanense]UNI16572.1 hypothetical protein JDV02_002998 [Purpureocillium takamizusanense]